MQTIGNIEFAWNIDIRVCVECRHSGIRGMQTFGYAWNADIRVCVECRHSGLRAWIASVGKHEQRARKESRRQQC